MSAERETSLDVLSRHALPALALVHRIGLNDVTWELFATRVKYDRADEGGKEGKCAGFAAEQCLEIRRSTGNIYRNIYDIYVCAIIGNYLIQRAKRRDRREIGALRIDGKYSKYN